MTATAKQDTATDSPTLRGWLRFLRHLVIMVAAMYVGMIVLDPVYGLLAERLGSSDPWTHWPVVSVFVMAFNMTLPMAALMRHHGHSWRLVAEMGAAMFIPAMFAAGLYLIGSATAQMVMSIEHLAMIPAMLAAMLYRYREYTA